MLNVEVIPYGGWQRCLRIRNRRIEAVITAEVGPRVIRFGFIGGPNEFVEYPDQMGLTGGDAYRSYGGHRLWVAPEDRNRTYAPDNAPVEWRVEGETLRVTAPVERSTGVQKEIQFWIDPEIDTMHLVHRITNCSGAPAALSAWALSVMAPGGRAIVPQEPFIPHPEALLPSRPLVLWSYTDMSDPRWVWGKELIQLFQDSSAVSPQKIGMLNKAGWLAYANGERLFLKTHTTKTGSAYPDHGSSAEVFTNTRMLELETLSPVTVLAPGAVLEHEEHWFLYDGVRLEREEAAILRSLSVIR